MTRLLNNTRNNDATVPQVPVRAACSGRAVRRGFTLIELLISIALIAVLLAGSFMAIDIFTQLFDTAQTKGERAQVIRSLAQQLSDDLHSAIQDPTTPPGMGLPGSASVRRFGLHGTSNTLRVDVLQLNPFERPSSSESSESVEEASQEHTAQAPELRTIFYTFVDPSSANMNDPTARPGLTRRELDFETPVGGSSGGVSEDAGLDEVAIEDEFAVEGELTDDTFQIEAIQQSPTSQSMGQMFSSQLEDADMWAPEVVGLKFRYFDGRRWSSSWDSLAKKGLPVAVEATMELRSFSEVEEQWSRKTQAATMAATTAASVDPFSDPLAADTSLDSLSSFDEFGMPADDMSFGLEGTDPLASEAVPSLPPGSKPMRPAAIHRVVIYLPGSPLAKPASKRKPTRPSTDTAISLPQFDQPVRLPAEPKVPKVTLPDPDRETTKPKKSTTKKTNPRPSTNRTNTWMRNG